MKTPQSASLIAALSLLTAAQARPAPEDASQVGIPDDINPPATTVTTTIGEAVVTAVGYIDENGRFNANDAGQAAIDSAETAKESIDSSSSSSSSSTWSSSWSSSLGTASSVASADTSTSTAAASTTTDLSRLISMIHQVASSSSSPTPTLNEARLDTIIGMLASSTTASESFSTNVAGCEWQVDGDGGYASCAGIEASATWSI